MSPANQGRAPHGCLTSTDALIGIAAGLVTIFAFFGISRWPPGPDSTPESPVVTPVDVPPSIDVAETHIPRIRAVIDQIERAEVEAFSTLNPSPLQSVYAREALRMALVKLDALRTRGAYEISQRTAADIESIDVSASGASATVRGSFQYETQFYSVITRACLARIEPPPSTQEILLELIDDVWMVTAVVFEESLAATPMPLPCE